MRRNEGSSVCTVYVEFGVVVFLKKVELSGVVLSLEKLSSRV